MRIFWRTSFMRVFVIVKSMDPAGSPDWLDLERNLGETEHMPTQLHSWGRA